MIVWVELPDAQEGHAFLIDGGSGKSFLPISVFRSIAQEKRMGLREPPMFVKAANGTEVICYGVCEVKVKIETFEMEHVFFIVEDTVMPILGRDFMKVHDVHHRVSTNKIYIGETEIPGYTMQGTAVKGKVSCCRMYVVRPQQEMVICAKISTKFPDGMTAVVTPARTIFHRTGILVCHTAVTIRDGLVPLRLLNAGEEPLVIQPNTVMAILRPIVTSKPWKDDQPVYTDDCECDCTCKALAETNSERQVAVYSNCKPEDAICEEEPLCCHKLAALDPDKRYETILAHTKCERSTEIKEFNHTAQVPAHVKQLYVDAVSRLNNDSQRERLAILLKEFSHIFAKTSDDIGKTPLLKHDIDTGDEAPVKQRCRRFAKCHIEIIQEHIKKLAAAGLIRPSESEWASNCLIVKKKDGTWRLCIDYRALNQKTKNPDSYSLPRIDDTIDALANAKYFSTLDLIQGYHQVELTERSKEKTAFHAPQVNPSHWEYVFMPFGLVRAPRTFQRLIDRVIRGLEYKIALAYLDDIIVFGPTLDACIDNLTVVFGRLSDANLKLKPKKCELFATEVNFLGHVITSKGVRTDPKKVESVVLWHPPNTVKNVRSFLGLVTYYSKFIKNFADICRPLHNLTRKGVKFKWTSECQEAFEEIKKRMVESPILAYPKSEGMFILDTDASKYAMGAVLSQLQVNDDGEVEERPIAFVSKNFTDAERRYCARRRELLAIIMFVKHFNVYLRGQTFKIRTDHASLQYIKTLKEIPDQFVRWIMQLEEYSYKIEIRKGTLHSNADAMSRGCHGKTCIC